MNRACIKKIKLLALSTAIFIFIFVVLGLPYQTMGFDSDCFGLVFYSASQKSFLQLLKNLFKPIQSCFVALNEQAAHQEGFLTYFRPLMTLSHYLCYQAFGLNSYGYFLLNVGLHAATTCGVFYIFTKLIPTMHAVLLALCFGFAPALTPAFVGVTSHVVPTYLFYVFSLITYIWFLETEKHWWYLSSVLFFLLSLLCYEIIAPLPFLLLFYLWFTQEKHKVAKTYLFFIALALYLVSRKILLGPSSATELQALTHNSLIKKIFMNWHQAIKPFWGLTNYSKYLAATITALFSGGLAWTIYSHKKQQAYLIFLTVLFFNLCWPISLITSDGRYFYPAIPLFLLIFYKILKTHTSKITPLILIIFCLWGGIHATQALQNRAFITNQRDQAFRQLAKKYKNKADLKLIMLGTIHSYNGDTLFMQQGMTQAARLFFDDPELKAYHVTEAKFYSIFPTDQTFEITPIKNGYRFTSPDPQNLFIMTPHSWTEEKPHRFSMGTIIVHKKDAVWKARSISFIFDEEILEQPNTVIVSLDLQTWAFKTLSQPK